MPLAHMGTPPPELTIDLRELLAKGLAADVMFHVSGEVFRAHWAVMAVQSVELLGITMKESTPGQVNIEEICSPLCSRPR